MRENVTFCSTFPIEENSHPKGEELARHIYEQLANHGFQISDFDNYDDFAWSCNVAVGRSTPWLILGFVGDEPHEWLLQINSGNGWFGRLIGANDSGARTKIATAIHKILSADSRFTEIRWHVGSFEEPGWATAP